MHPPLNRCAALGARILTLQPSDDTWLAELMAARQAYKGEVRRWLVKAIDHVDVVVATMVLLIVVV